MAIGALSGGAVFGILCTLAVIALGAAPLSALLVYSVSGTLGTFSLALMALAAAGPDCAG